MMERHLDLVGAARDVAGGPLSITRWIVRAITGAEMVRDDHMEALRSALRTIPEGAGLAARADLYAAASILGPTHPRLAERLILAARSATL
jgi:hypothetical protein